MDKKEFIDLAKDCGAYTPYKPGGVGLCFLVEWRCGGVTGNSCWGQDPRSVDPDEPETCIKEFDQFLLKVCPNISFMQYRVLEHSVLKHEGYTDGSDYYGNYSNYQYLMVNVDELYEKLNEMGLLSQCSYDSSGLSM